MSKISLLRLSANALKPSTEWDSLSKNLESVASITLATDDRITLQLGKDIVYVYSLKFWLNRTIKVPLFLENDGTAYRSKIIQIDNRLNLSSIKAVYKGLEIIIKPNNYYELKVDDDDTYIDLICLRWADIKVKIMGIFIQDNFKTF
jgi:hypothetical protein